MYHMNLPLKICRNIILVDRAQYERTREFMQRTFELLPTPPYTPEIAINFVEEFQRLYSDYARGE